MTTSAVRQSLRYATGAVILAASAITGAPALADEPSLTTTPTTRVVTSTPAVDAPTTSQPTTPPTTTAQPTTPPPTSTQPTTTQPTTPPPTTTAAPVATTGQFYFASFVPVEGGIETVAPVTIRVTDATSGQVFTTTAPSEMILPYGTYTMEVLRYPAGYALTYFPETIVVDGLADHAQITFAYAGGTPPPPRTADRDPGARVPLSSIPSGPVDRP